MKLHGRRGLDPVPLLALCALSLAPRAAAGAQAVQAPYTAAQAEAGEAIYATACASCHLTNFQGAGEAPALAGPDFLNLWGPEPIGGLIELVALTMPPTSPGSLTDEEYAGVVAYLPPGERRPGLGHAPRGGVRRAGHGVDGRRRGRAEPAARARPPRQCPLGKRL